MATTAIVAAGGSPMREPTQTWANPETRKAAAKLAIVMAIVIATNARLVAWIRATGREARIESRVGEVKVATELVLSVVRKANCHRHTVCARQRAGGAPWKEV